MPLDHGHPSAATALLRRVQRSWLMPRLTPGPSCITCCMLCLLHVGSGRMAWTLTYSWRAKYNFRSWGLPPQSQYALNICTPGSHNSYPFFPPMKQSCWAATPGLSPQLLGVPAGTVSLALAGHQGGRGFGGGTDSSQGSEEYPLWDQSQSETWLLIREPPGNGGRGASSACLTRLAQLCAHVGCES